MPATLGTLLARPEFRLTVVGGLGRPDVLDRPIAWVHNSDLADPTPWLEPGGLLLTDGVQFSATDDGDVAVRYVDRLLDREVLALGFATEVAHAAIPAPLVAACEARGLPLLEVGARTRRRRQRRRADRTPRVVARGPAGRGPGGVAPRRPRRGAARAGVADGMLGGAARRAR